MAAIYFNGNLRDALTAFKDKPKWLIHPYLPATGVVFMHGKFSLGKSPLVWRVMQAVSEGVDFFDYPVQDTGNVLYIENDEPLLQTVERLKLLNPVPKNVTVLGMRVFSIMALTPEDTKVFTELNITLKPKLVVCNTLRKSHNLDDKESTTPSLVYGKWQELFPDSCILFVAHDKKSSTKNFDGPTDEDFSGSQAWVNDAQVGLHVTAVENRKSRTINLAMTKAQFSAYPEPMHLKLGPDGVNWLDVGPGQIRKTFASLDPTLGKMERYEETAKRCQVSLMTVRRSLDPKSSIVQTLLNPDTAVTH